MAKIAKQAKKKDGPHLAASFFCETLVEDKRDGALCAIRIIDTITVQLPPSSSPEIPPEIPVRIAALLSFKSGDSPGEHTVRIVMHSPSGEKSRTVLEQIVPFTPQPQGGANLRLDNVIIVKTGGVFWMDIFLDGKRVTRMPLKISIQLGEAIPGQSADVERKPDGRAR